MQKSFFENLLFSERTNWPSEENRISQLHQQLLDGGTSLMDLTCSNPTKADLSLPTQEMLAQIHRHASIEYDPDPKGDLAARKSIQTYYAEKQLKVSVDDILLTPGTSESYLFALKLLTNAKDKVLIQKPGYPLIEMLTHIADIEPLAQVSYHLDSKKISEPNFSSTDQIKALFIVQPQNPTGAMFSKCSAETIALNATQNNIPVISDEVFLDFNFGMTHDLYSWATFSRSPSIVMGGVSKLLCLPQAKCSWMLLSGPTDWKNEAMRRLTILSDAFLSSSPIIQKSIPYWFTFQNEITQIVNQRLSQNYAFISEFCKKHKGFEILSQPAGWSVVLGINHEDEGFAYELLKTKNILVHPGYLFDLDEKNCIVLSLLTPSDILHNSLPKLLAFLFSLGK